MLGMARKAAKNGVLRNRLRESGKQTGFVKSLRQKKYWGNVSICYPVINIPQHAAN